MKYILEFNCMCKCVYSIDVESDDFNIKEIADDVSEQFKNQLVRLEDKNGTVSLINTKNIIAVNIRKKTDTQVVVQSEEGVV